MYNTSTPSLHLSGDDSSQANGGFLEEHRSSVKATAYVPHSILDEDRSPQER